MPFCGHATVATAVALGPGAHRVPTNAGEVPVTVDADRPGHPDQRRRPRTAELTDADLDALLAALRLGAGGPGPGTAAAGRVRRGIPPGRSPCRTRQRLADLDYDVPALKALMERADWTTVQLVWRESADTFHVRDPFPVGGVYEDPATGAAAAAFGGYLRELGLVGPDATLHLAQGDDMGRPGRLTVTLVPGEPGVRVSGTAVPITG